MGMTLWIQTLKGSDASLDSDDHSWMYRFADVLDERCLALKVAKLSTFFDETDLAYNFDDHLDDLDEEALEEVDRDPVADAGYGIDDMPWFDAADGLKTLQALRDDLASHRLEDMSDEDRDELLDELNNCVRILIETAGSGGRFHLLIVA